MRFLPFFIAPAALMLAACAGDAQQRAKPTPASASPGVLAITANNFMDTDGNKYRDLSTVVVYIFPDSAQYALPLAPEGAFEFTLESSQGEPIRRWRFSPDQTREARRDLAPGPGFVFDLSLLADAGTDRLAFSEAELVAAFHPDLPSPRPLRARTQSPLLIGSVGRSGGIP